MDWLRRSADAGDREALFALGRMYDAGRFVARDANLAAAFYDAAAAAGHLEAIVAGSALVGEAEATE
jgi:TPR repeat protein